MALDLGTLTGYLELGRAPVAASEWDWAGGVLVSCRDRHPRIAQHSSDSLKRTVECGWPT